MVKNNNPQCVSSSLTLELWQYQPTLRQVVAQSSMSHKENLYDNAMMESFYKKLKRELINGTHFKTRSEASREIFKYMESYYNAKRMHSALDYKSSKT